jgi:L-rhamnose mutarotase
VCGGGAGEAISCNTAALEYSQGHLQKGKAYTVYFLKEIWEEMKHMFTKVSNYSIFVAVNKLL